MIRSLEALRCSNKKKFEKRKLKIWIIYALRNRYVSFLTRRLGLSVCSGYIPLTANNASALVERAERKVNYLSVHEANGFITSPPGCLEEQKCSSISPVKVELETIFLDIKDKEFSLRNNHLLDFKMNVIDETGIQFNKMPIRRKILSRTVDLEATVAYLSNTDPSNYYHWMCRTLPLIRFYEKFCGLDAIDFFYVGQFPITNFHRESLARAGIPSEKVTQKACTADRIVAAITNRSRHQGSAPIIEENYLFTRGLFCNLFESGKRRIYVSRGNVARRKLLNELEVINLLEGYGFTVVSMDGKTLNEQVKIFSSAEAVIAPHGAALTNLLFIQPMTKVIELIPYGFINNCFYVLSSYAGADYFYVIGEEINQPHIDPHHFNIFIDIQKLKKICDKVFDLL